MRLTILVVVLGLIGCAACDRKSPAAPSPPPITTTALAISGPDTLLTGVPVTYSVIATLSDGTTATVTPVWTISDPAIATVDTTGRLEGRSHGSTNVVATYEGRTTSRNLHVVMNYAGDWNATFLVGACTDSGELTNYDGGWCRSGPGRVGSVVSGVRIALAQGGTNLREITGTYGYFAESLTGMVTDDGRLSLAGTFLERDWWEDPERILSSWRIHAWDSAITGPDAMVGRFSEHLDSLYPRRGTADEEIEVVTMMRTARSAAPVR